jgi:hypothetical protein
VFLCYVFFYYYGIYSYDTELRRYYEQLPFSVRIRARHLDVFVCEVRRFTVNLNVNIPLIFVLNCNNAARMM